MRKSTTHRLVIIAILLLVFSVPFYLERSQISSFNDSAYMAGAVLSSTRNNTPPPSDSNSDVTQASVGTSVLGQSFISGQLSVVHNNHVNL